MYLGMVEEEDKKLAESRKADAEVILVFVSPSSTRRMNRLWCIPYPLPILPCSFTVISL